MEFSKIKKLLEKNPQVLKEDPLLGIDYLKIINMIKRKKLAEMTSDPYNPAEAIDSTFLDIDQIEREELLRKKRDEDRFRKEMSIEQSSASVGDRLQLEDQDTDVSVRAAKKREEREKNKLLKQFDALAETY